MFRGTIAATPRSWRVQGTIGEPNRQTQVYAAFGVALCGDVLPGREHWVYGSDDGAYHDDVIDDVLERHRVREVMDNRFEFNTFARAWATLIEIFLTNNWQDIVNAYLTSGAAKASATAGHRATIAAFFVSFYVISVMFLTNVPRRRRTNRSSRRRPRGRSALAATPPRRFALKSPDAGRRRAHRRFVRGRTSRAGIQPSLPECPRPRDIRVAPRGGAATPPSTTALPPAGISSETGRDEPLRPQATTASASRTRRCATSRRGATCRATATTARIATRARARRGGPAYRRGGRAEIVGPGCAMAFGRTSPAVRRCF